MIPLKKLLDDLEKGSRERAKKFLVDTDNRKKHTDLFSESMMQAQQPVPIDRFAGGLGNLITPMFGL